MDKVSMPSEFRNDRDYDSPRRWIICILGSLRNTMLLLDQDLDPNVNILIICFTNEDISQTKMDDILHLVYQTEEGGFMIIRQSK